MDNLNLNEVAALQTSAPYKTYRKTILAQVGIIAFNSVTNKVEEKILFGNPLEEDAMFDVYSEMEDMFFRRNNKHHLKEGTLIEYNKVVVENELPAVEQMSDEKIRTLVNSKFVILQNTLKSTTSEVFLNRVRDIAVEEEKSDKILGHIDTRISEVQLSKSKL